MTHRIAYYRVSTKDQSIEAQRSAMGGTFDQEFKDEGVSGGTLAAKRPAKLPIIIPLNSLFVGALLLKRLIFSSLITNIYNNLDPLWMYFVRGIKYYIEIRVLNYSAYWKSCPAGQMMTNNSEQG